MVGLHNDEDGRIGHRFIQPARRVKSPTGEPSVVVPPGKRSRFLGNLPRKLTGR